MKLQVLSLLVGYLISSDREGSSKSFYPNPKFKEINSPFWDCLNDLVCNLVPQNLTTILPGNLAVLRTLAHYY